MSYAWTEIGIRGNQYDAEAIKISATSKDIWLVRIIVFLQVIPAFAFNSFLALATAGGAMPDWGYEEDYVIRKMRRWSNGLFIFSFINPFWWLGLPLSFLFSFVHYIRIEKAILRNAQPVNTAAL